MASLPSVPDDYEEGGDRDKNTDGSDTTLAISRVLTVWTSCVIKVASRKQLFTPKMADAQ